MKERNENVKKILRRNWVKRKYIRYILWEISVRRSDKEIFRRYSKILDIEFSLKSLPRFQDQLDQKEILHQNSR